MIVASRRAVTSSLVLALVVGCGGGGGGKYAGTYKRELSNEGEVKMSLGGDGNVELNLPSPRWADNPTIKSKATFKGDTLVFPADSSMSCATSEAKYLFSQASDGLQVSGVGLDGCGNRRAAMVGSWQKG